MDVEAHNEDEPFFDTHSSACFAQGSSYCLKMSNLRQHQQNLVTL